MFKDFDIHQQHIKAVPDILRANPFSFSAEIIPPRNGTDFTQVFEHIAELHRGDFDFISVTHGAGGSLRGGTLPIAYHTQNAAGMVAIAHLTCRNVTREDLENSLIDHHYFGIHNILALRGDPPDGIGAEFKPVEGGFKYAYELAELIKLMNDGKYTKRRNFDKGETEYREGMKTRFSIGAACYPEDPDEVNIEYLARKREAGAEYAITQMIFDLDAFERFYARVVDRWGHSFQILPAIRIPKSEDQLLRMRDKFGVNVPPRLLQQMKKAGNRDGKEGMRRFGLEWALEFAERVYKMGIKGLHLFIMNDPASAVELKQKFERKVLS